MANFFFTFQPGEFVQVLLPCGSSRVGQIHSVTNINLSVSWWSPDIEEECVNATDLLLPARLSDTREQDIIPIPSISSVAFVFNLSDLSDFKVRFSFGMVSILCSRSFLTPITHQSVSFIIIDSITWISSELQRVLNNRREHQEVFSSFTLQLSCLTWNYLVESLKVPEHVKTKVVTFSMMYNKDLSSLRVKSRRLCLIFFAWKKLRHFVGSLAFLEYQR